MFKSKAAKPSDKLLKILSVFNKTIEELEEVISSADEQTDIKKEEQKKIEDEITSLTLTSIQASTFKNNLTKLLGNK